MDADTALNLADVTGVWNDKDAGNYRIQFTVPASTPVPDGSPNPVGDFTDALTYTHAEWPAVTAGDVGTAISLRWTNWLAAASPPPPPPDPVQVRRDELLAELEHINLQLAERAGEVSGADA